MVASAQLSFGYSRGQARPMRQYGRLRRSAVLSHEQVLLKYRTEPVIDTSRRADPSFRQPTRYGDATVERLEQAAAAKKKVPERKPQMVPVIKGAKAAFQRYPPPPRPTTYMFGRKRLEEEYGY